VSFDGRLVDPHGLKAPFQRASFSLYLRYSSSVVAPDGVHLTPGHIGLSMLDASRPFRRRRLPRCGARR